MFKAIATNRAVCILSAALLGSLTLPTWAATTVERGSSVVIFPKVLHDPDGIIESVPTETLIQIANTSNSLVRAHCFYVNSAPQRPAEPLGPDNPAQWQEINFDILLTKQQPTHWVVGSGRSQNPNDPICSGDPQTNTVTNRNCVNAGFDPGRVPLVPEPFVGELRCVEVDSSGAPINGNHLKGEATIVRRINSRFESSKYNAIGLYGLNDDNSNNSDFTLCIGGDVRPGCPTGPEYSACPQALIATHYAIGSRDPVVDQLSGSAGPVTTELTIVPCTQDLERLARTQVQVQFRVTNEFEDLFSASTEVDCWRSFTLDEVGANVFSESVVGTRFLHTRMSTPADQSGIVGVIEEVHSQGAILSTAMRDLHGVGQRDAGDTITIPEGR